MKTLITLIAIIITLCSCSKLEDLSLPPEDYPTYTEVHVYYDSAVYAISINETYVTSGNEHKQGVDIYRVDSLSNLNFHIMRGKRTAVTVQYPRYRQEYGYVRNIRSGLVSPY